MSTILSSNPMQTTKTNTMPRHKLPLAFAALLVAAVPSWAQQATTSTVPKKEDEVVELSPFEVTAGDNESYTAATTLAGNRLNTELRDIGNSVTVITSQ